MNLCHTLVLAFVGWLFMTPPVSKSGEVLCEAPLRNWEHENGGKSQAECEKNKQEAIRLMRMLSPDEKLKVVQAGKCIATDDPRLAK
jgi:hypothetical protein